MAADTPPSGVEWIAAFARQLGTDAPDAELTEALLALAAVAAHASERTAAPIACYLAGRTGMALPEAVALARATQP